MSSFFTTWQSAEAVVPFVDKMAAFFDGQDGLQRRSEVRKPVAVPLRLRVLDDLWEPVSEPIDGVSRNISHSGVGFYHLQPIDGQFVEMTLNSPDGNQMRVVAEIRHTTPIGQFKYSGARFLFGGGDL